MRRLSASSVKTVPFALSGGPPYWGVGAVVATVAVVLALERGGIGAPVPISRPEDTVPSFTVGALQPESTTPKTTASMRRRTIDCIVWPPRMRILFLSKYRDVQVSWWNLLSHDDLRTL